MKPTTLHCLFTRMAFATAAVILASEPAVAAAFEKPLEAIERNLVFHPDKTSAPPPKISGVEWVDFQVFQSVPPKKRRSGPSFAENLLNSMFDDIAEDAIAGAIHLGVDAALDIDHEKCQDDDEDDYEWGVNGPADVARMEAEFEQSRREEAERDRERDAQGDEQEPSEHTPSIPGVRIWKLSGAIAEAPKPAERRAVMLYFHGSKDRLDDSAVRLQRTAQRYNVTIMGFDYRGHGRSEGRPSESAVLDDARAARSYLAKRTGVSEQAIVLLGSGFGTGIAVDLAAYDGCRGLILENAYTSLRDAADSQAPGWMKPSRFMDTRMSSIYKITFYHGPLLQCHGDANTVVPFEQGRQLFKTANDPKKFVTIRNGKHDDPLSEEFKAAIDEFIQFLPHEPPATAASRASLSTAVNSSPAGPATTEKLLTK